jgi:hypothetical protein
VQESGWIVKSVNISYDPSVLEIQRSLVQECPNNEATIRNLILELDHFNKIIIRQLEQLPNLEDSCIFNPKTLLLKWLRDYCQKQYKTSVWMECLEKLLPEWHTKISSVFTPLPKNFLLIRTAEVNDDLLERDRPLATTERQTFFQEGVVRPQPAMGIPLVLEEDDSRRFHLDQARSSSTAAPADPSTEHPGIASVRHPTSPDDQTSQSASAVADPATLLTVATKRTQLS